MVRLDGSTIFVNFRFDVGEPSGLAKRVQRPVDGDPVRPRSELRISAVARQGAEDLNPDFLRDIGCQVRIGPDKPAHDHIDVRSVPSP